MSDIAATTGLTPKQIACMRVIQGALARTGVCPTYGEIAEDLELASRTSVLRLLQPLVERGYLARVPGGHRSLSILRPVPMPDLSEPKFVLSADLAERRGQ